MRQAPVCLPASFLPSHDADPETGFGAISAWCPWCETRHWHGAAGKGGTPRQELRGAHCAPALGSPVAGRGYRLAIGQCEPDAALVRPGHRLYHSLCEHQGDLRRAMLLSVLSASVSKFHLAQGSIIGAALADKELLLTVAGQSWRLSAVDREWSGDGLLTLFARLFCVSPGIAARRILETLAAVRLSPDAALSVERTIDHWAGGVERP